MATKIVISPSDILFTDIPNVGVYESNHLEQRHNVGSVSYRVNRHAEDPHVPANDIIQFYVRDSGKNIKGGKGSDFADDTGTPFADVDAVIAYIEANDFFFGLNEITVPVQVDGIVNYIDLGGLRAENVNVTNAGNVTISEIRNVPKNHVFWLYPESPLQLTLQRTSLPIGQNQISGQGAFVQIEGVKHEVALMKERTVGGVSFCHIMFGLTNIA